MTPPPNSTADNIDGINTDYDADQRAKSYYWCFQLAY